MNFWTSLTAAVVASTLLTATAQAGIVQSQQEGDVPDWVQGTNYRCGPRANLKEIMGIRFGEAPVSSGLTLSGRLLEIYSAEGGKTWTVIMTNPATGRSCILSAGRSWERLPFPGEGSPTHYYNPIHSWYNGLRNPRSGVSCCNERDCRAVPYRTTPGRTGVEVETDAGWVTVPSDTILPVYSPDSDAHACWPYNSSGTAEDLRCVILPGQGV